jgi:hypothetical protein
MTTTAKRRYTRLSPAVWAEIRGLWEVGDSSLAELSDRFGVSTRALQAHFAKHGITKGSKAAEVAIRVREEVFSKSLPDEGVLTERAKQVRETAYTNAVALEALVMSQVEIARSDPSQAVRASTVIKGLAIAASALERLHGLKFRALGLDKVVDEEELPVLRITTMTKEEARAIRDSFGNEDELEAELAGDAREAGATAREEPSDIEPEGHRPEWDEEVVVEDLDEAEGDKARAPDQCIYDAEGYRLVRDALPNA